MVSDRDMNDIAPWGETWGRTSKRKYKNAIINMFNEIQMLKTQIYARDLLYNPCHNLSASVEFEKDLNIEGSV